MNLWMVYICNMKRSRKYKRWEEGECILHRWPKSWEICACNRPFYEFQRHLVESEEQHQKWRGNTSPGKKKLLFEIKEKES